MKKLLVVLLFFFVSLSLHATHIVGGEFQLYWKQGYNYALEMNFYYDDISATPELLTEDLTIEVAIYEKVTNALVQTVILQRISDNFIPYQYVQCTNFNSTQVRTRLLKYVVDSPSRTIELSPKTYNSSNGYYVVWERCCRNYEISNIVNPDETGQAFYMEFPPLSVFPPEGYAFNSEPIFKTLTGDFPCGKMPFTFDFSGADPNGDSLVYSMATPLAGHATSNYYYPGAEPVPPFPADDPQGDYPLIAWQPTYSANNAIHGVNGLNNLSIDPHTGILSVTPSDSVLALYAFGVLCKEYRNGKQIGLIRRDFQFWVVPCPVNPGPAISLQIPNPNSPGTTITYTETDTVKIQMTDKDTCFTTLILDTSTAYPKNEDQTITLFNVTPNSPPGLLSIPGVVKLPATPSSKTPVAHQSTLCFNPCYTLNIVNDTLIKFTIAIEDQSCPRPKTDTLKINVLFIPPVVSKPNIVIKDLEVVDTAIVLVDTSITQNDTITLYTNETITFDVIGTVKGGYALTLTGNGKDFSFSEYGMKFNTVTGSDSVVSQFSWKVNCNAINKSPFVLQFVASDKNCSRNRADTTYFTIRTKDYSTTLPDIKPYNIVTPNGDYKNDTLSLPHPPELPVPPDNCQYYFKNITIYDRWGGEIYLNTNRNFVWDPGKDKTPDGVYFYLIDLNAKKLKGWVEVIR